MMLFATTLNRPSGGVERAICNGILWHGPSPRPSTGTLTIEGPSELAMGQTIQLTVPGASEVVWTCQGGAWIDQDGTLRPVKEGVATVQALIGGRVIERKITVK